MRKVSFGLFEYKTENIGDEIQSIAARRFLPRVDYYFDRDNIDAVKIKKGEAVKLIMNGWFTHKPENWPPKREDIDPLLISMHIEQDTMEGRAVEAFLSDSSKAFLKKFGPVGARNYPTMELLRENGVEAYFSGCVTLTLVPDKRIRREDYILAVDVSDKVYDRMKKLTNRKIIRLNTERKTAIDRETKFAVANLWLFLYQSAHAVVTSRLHTMLPCLAFETPVITIIKKEPRRFKGLIDLTNTMTESEFLTSRVDLDNPEPNPDNYLMIREELETKCKHFTGYDSHDSFLSGMPISELFSNQYLIGFLVEAAEDSWLLESMKKEYDELVKREKFYRELSENCGKKNAELEQKLNDALHPGVKGAVKLLKTSVMHKVAKTLRPKSA